MPFTRTLATRRAFGAPEAIRNSIGAIIEAIRLQAVATTERRLNLRHLLSACACVPIALLDLLGEPVALRAS